METAVISGLYVYPVKSMRGIPRSRVRLAPTGFEWDRQWMVINDRGVFLSQRTHPKLARIVPEVTQDALILSAPGRPHLVVPLATSGARIDTRVWKDSCAGIDQGAAAHAWVSEVLGQAVRLVRVAPDMGRFAEPRFAGPAPAPLNYPDGYPILICNEASLADLNGKLPAHIPIERFRPNIVVRGLAAWAEDRIETLTIGPITLRLVKPCTRCAIPGLDHVTGDPSTDPMPVLKRFRFDKAFLGVTFGENAVIETGAGCEISTGSHCQVELV